MTRAEALEFAEEMRDKLTYRLECAKNVPARSYYEKQWEMLIQAITALREQEQREQGCERCDIFRKDPHYYISGGNGQYTDVVFKFCPVCGRRLED